MHFRDLFTHWPTKKKLSLLLLIIFLPASGVIVASSFKQRAHEVEMARNNALLMVQSLAAQQEQIITGTKQMLSTLAQLPEVHDIDTNACNTLFNQLNKRYPFYSILAGTTPDGNMFAASTPFEPNSINLSDRKHLRDALSTLDFSAGEYIVGRASKISSINYAYPVLDANRTPLAILIAGFKLDEYALFIKNAHLPEGSVVVITDHKGLRLFSMPETDTAAIGKSISSKALEKISSDLDYGVFEQLSEDGVYRIYAYKQLRLRDNSRPYMYMFVGLPKNKILAAANHEMWRNLTIFGLAFLVAITLVWRLANFVLVKPINKLVDATLRFGHGEMNARTHLPHSSDELGKLAKSFDDMASLLEKKDLERKKAEGALKYAYDNLEQRVQERTHELTASNKRLAQEVMEREQAEKALKQESTRRRIMFEQSPDGILIIDPQTKRFQDFNTAAHRQLGYSREEFAQLSISDVEVLETVEDTEIRVARVMHDGHADFETQQRTRSGEIRDIHVTAQTIDIQGELVYHCIWRDITERKRTEKELLREQLFGSTLLNSLPGIFYLYTYPELRLVRWNKNHETLLGFGPGEIKGRSVFDWHMPEAKDAVLHAIEEAMERGQNTIESPLLTKTGHSIPFLLTGAKFEFSSQAYLMGVGLDITERKKAEAALRESEEKYRLIFESANDAIFICDMQGRLLNVNTLACERLGYTRTELMSMTVGQVDGDEDAKHVSERMKRLRDQGHLTFETTHQCKNGALIPVEVSAWRITWEGQPVIMSISRDMTERKRSEEEKKLLQAQLIQAQKMEAIGTLAGGIAHDFNNILGGILGYAELARNACPSGSKAISYLDKELEAVHRASALVKGFLKIKCSRSRQIQLLTC